MSKLKEKKILKLTTEQELKLIQLRADREKDQILNKPNKTPDPLTGGVPVFVCLEGVSFSGYITHETENSFDVKTPHGNLNVPKTAVKKRQITDYSNVEVPEKLKAMTTKELLRELQWTRTPGYYYNEFDDVNYYLTKYTDIQIKAVLSTREHIPSKRETKIARKYAK